MGPGYDRSGRTTQCRRHCEERSDEAIQCFHDLAPGLPGYALHETMS